MNRIFYGTSIYVHNKSKCKLKCFHGCKLMIKNRFKEFYMLLFNAESLRPCFTLFGT